MVPNIAVILTDARKHILWVNNDFTELTGYTLGEAIGRQPGRLLQGADTDPNDVRRIGQALSAQIPFKDEILNYRKNGEAYTCRLVIHPVFDAQHELCNFIAFEVDGDKVSDDELNIPLLDLDNKYSTSSLKGVEEVQLFLKLKHFLEKDQPYLDPNLTLKCTADHLHTNTKYLSQVVNHLSNHNFQYFINTFRVNEAKHKLLSDDYQHLTLYGIALQCGFKNKSTFYKVFKEITNLTPREFIMFHKNRNN
ncbi:helix-turn-helix domain-containing protein [Flavilitoribacter nigricans]|uniref:AraC family transcriptional regulator n=1 Tax=Flavilitoribacter nigricans (strain ATCC 23147 / DSM 23189 / NBRC 102662 / NCIMB 1420 / SS-2) TaxID=1122177 RepID=A0A2D0N244_FLAN2|nr:helix-turn-helix domain-containing protein [Flavilitoribacter nigricans]PHN01803.1 AraC family transcriptional regulator [Flavilitoribacter nigricans DSM 23189 = NBRC 102662]